MTTMRRSPSRGAYGHRAVRTVTCSVIALCAMLVACADVAGSTMVFPPGQEALLAEMFGGTASADCTFTNGSVAGAILTAEYACPTGTVILEIGHPDAARDADLRTDRFAIGVRSGTPPPDFLTALQSRVRAREGGFAWSAGSRSGTRGAGAASGSTRDGILLLAVIILPGATCVVGLALLGRIVLRRRRRTSRRG